MVAERCWTRNSNLLGVLRLDCQCAVCLQQLQLQHLALSLQLEFVAGGAAGRPGHGLKASITTVVGTPHLYG